jgi:hypothetical protein
LSTVDTDRENQGDWTACGPSPRSGAISFLGMTNAWSAFGLPYRYFDNG